MLLSSGWGPVLHQRRSPFFRPQCLVRLVLNYVAPQWQWYRCPTPLAAGRRLQDMLLQRERAHRLCQLHSGARRTAACRPLARAPGRETECLVRDQGGPKAIRCTESRKCRSTRFRPRQATPSAQSHYADDKATAAMPRVPTAIPLTCQANDGDRSDDHDVIGGFGGPDGG